MIERETALRNGHAVLYERKYHGVLREDGRFRLLAYCGKWFPLSKGAAEPSENAQQSKKQAA